MPGRDAYGVASRFVAGQYPHRSIYPGHGAYGVASRWPKPTRSRTRIAAEAKTI